MSACRMPALGPVREAVLLHLLNINLLMDLGAPPPDLAASVAESFPPNVDEREYSPLLPFVRALGYLLWLFT